MKGSEIKQFRIKHDLTQEELGKIVGVKAGTVATWEQGTRNISASAVKLMESYEAGKKRPNESNKQETNTDTDAVWVQYSTFKMVPLVGHRAQAGFLAGWGDPEYVKELPKVPFEVDREYKGHYVCFEVSGDSMDNGTTESILENDILLCREVQRHHWQNHLHINQWDFVIVHRTDGILVKRITEHQTDTGKLTLHSLNPIYDDLDVFMDDLVAIFNVVDIKRNVRRR